MNKNLLLSISLFGASLMMAQNQGKNAADLPYSYGFETSDLDGWTIINAGTGNDWAVTQKTSQTPEPSEGSNYMMYYFHDNPANSYLFSKGLNLKSGETINLKFDYMGTDVWFPEKMEVLIGTSPDVAAMTKQLWIDDEITNYPYDTASVNFTVPADGVYYIAFRAFSDPDQFYLSLDNIKVTSSNLATENTQLSKLSFYPNPVKNVLNITHDIVITTIAIFDMSGKLQMTKSVNAQKDAIDISSLAKGNYMLRVATKDGAKTMKIIKD